MTGARKILVAYNVNLLATKQQANRIALNIRETGKRKVDPLHTHVHCHIYGHYCMYIVHVHVHVYVYGIFHLVK